MVDYSKWKNIEISDDEDDTHPNIDTPSLFRWRHQARVERMQEIEEEKKKLEAAKKETLSKLEQLKVSKEKGDPVPDDRQKEYETIQKKLEEVQKHEAELQKKEKSLPWNVDTISKEGWSKTVLNKPQTREQKKMTEEEREEHYRKFVKENEPKIKNYGMLSKWDDCRSYLLENPHLCCEETANYLTFWCLNLEIEEKSSLAEHIAKQVISMQYILELSKQLDVDPRSCISSFFTRIQKADKEYIKAFEDELDGFKKRVKDRARIKIEEAMKEIEEEEKQKRLGPGGLDPVEVFESLPEKLQKCFESRDIASLQQAIADMDPEEAKYHMKRCVDSGLWIPDANKGDGKGDENDADNEEEYETLEAVKDKKEASK